MKKISLLLIGLLLVPTLFLTSCDKGDDPTDATTTTTPSFTLLKNYMVSNDLDINNILVNTDGAKFVTGAPAAADLQTFLDKYYIIDIRGAADYDAGHIQGAKNVPFANILTDAPNAAGDPILVVCYTGQTACYATSLLRLSGYSSTQSLKWGMSGWNVATSGAWYGAVSDIAAGHTNWVSSSAPTPIVFDDPVITSASTVGADILEARIALVVSEGFKGVNGTDVLNNPGDHFINNYFSEADYTGFGHIANAYRITEDLKLDGNGYKGLDPDSSSVVNYCYTGQTSAVLTAWLRVIGYDAYSLKFGMNGLYNSNPAFTTNQWGVDSLPKDLPIVIN